MNPPTPYSSLIPHPSSLSFPGCSRISAGKGALHHVLVDGDDAAAIGRIELQTANHAPECLAQGAGAEAFLASGVPGDGDQRRTRDLQVDSEALEIRPGGAEDRAVGLHEDARQIRLRQIVEDDDRLEARDELRRHSVAEEILV